MVKRQKKSLNKAYLKRESFTGSWCLRPLNYKQPITYPNKEKDRTYTA
jgi:hypothetical protein